MYTINDSSLISNSGGTHLSASLLICVYKGDEAAHFQLAMESIFRQSKLPEEVVLIVDGPVGSAITQIIGHFHHSEGDLLTVYHLPENVGFIKALNRGLQYCNHPLIIRLDADDIAHQDRVRQQTQYMAAHPEISLLGSQMTDFVDSPENTLRSKVMPLSHDDIKKKLPWRNPINHPTVCFRRDAVIDVGGYPELQYLEDYWLWSQLISNGYRCQNLDTSLVSYRFDDATLQRRSGTTNFLNEVRLRWWLVKHKLCSIPVFMLTSAMQLVLRFAPISIKRFLWKISRN